MMIYTSVFFLKGHACLLEIICFCFLFFVVDNVFKLPEAQLRYYLPFISKQDLLSRHQRSMTTMRQRKENKNADEVQSNFLRRLL